MGTSNFARVETTEIYSVIESDNELIELLERKNNA